MHSSSIAFIERDIEQLASPHPLTTQDPRQISRVMTNELATAVPSVLSSTTSTLNIGSDEDINVLVP